MFPLGFDVCDSAIGVQGNMSGVTIRKSGSNETRQMRFYKAASTLSANRGITEPSIALQRAQRPIPRTGLLQICNPRVPLCFESHRPSPGAGPGVGFSVWMVETFDSCFEQALPTGFSTRR